MQRLPYISTACGKNRNRSGKTGEWNFPEKLQFTEPTLAAKIAVGVTGAACVLIGVAFRLLLVLEAMYQSWIRIIFAKKLFFVLDSGETLC